MTRAGENFVVKNSGSGAAAEGRELKARSAPTSGQLNVILQRRLRALIVAKHGGGEARAAKAKATTRDVYLPECVEVTVCAVTVCEL